MPKQKRLSAPQAKRIVYLWGAGATQAEISYLGAHPINLLMRDNELLGEGLATRILKRLNKRWRSAFSEDQGMDIEKLISLLVACNVEELSTLAETIRRLYFTEIRNSLVTAKVIFNPQLATGLLHMHKNEQFQRKVEVLSGIITTNHDGLLQVAAQKVLNEVNIGFPFTSTDITHQPQSSSPPILHLHGSFTWKFSLPIEVTRLSKESAYSADTVCIPPTILKESKTYPFNKLAGLAYELLSKHCDVLRVVGSSLTQNDWNILSMIFNAQRHRELTKGSAFRIELIMSHKGGQAIARECSYFKNITPIGHLTEGQFADYKEDELMHIPEMKNALAYWLKQKIHYHQNRGDFGPDSLNPAMAKIVGEIA